MSQSAYDFAEDDEIERAFPGSTLTHVFTVVSKDQLSVAIETLVAIRAAGGHLGAMRLTRRAETFEHKLTVTGLRPQQARAVADRLAAASSVDHATIEHCLLRS